MSWNTRVPHELLFFSQLLSFLFLLFTSETTVHYSIIPSISFGSFLQMFDDFPIL
jgi:hypothetical protein